MDRDILDLLEAPLGHLLRNAIDHGIEAPHVRVARGKPEEGTLTLDARHTAGALLISVSERRGHRPRRVTRVDRAQETGKR